MTQVFAIDGNNDLYLDNANNIAVLRGQDAVQQACLTASRTQLGECVLETGRGLPNFQAIWVGTPNYSLWKSYLQNTLQNVNGVLSVGSIAAERRGDVLSYTARIESAFGITALTGAIDNG